MTFPKEFKEAISNLPSKEKDKLILKLLKHDIVLANSLFFELVSDVTVEEQREEVKHRLSELIRLATKNFYSLGYLYMDVRSMSGEITEHVKITKDKYGEIALNLFILNEILEKNNKRIAASSKDKAHSFCTAVIARTYRIIILIKKMHDDYFLEFGDDLRNLGNRIADNNRLMECAIFNGLDINWLILRDIPVDIEIMHKELRQQGYLK